MTAAGFKYLKAVSELGACGVKITAISEKTGRFEIGYKIWVKMIGYIKLNIV